MGVLMISILKDTIPQNGVSVSIRNEGKIVGNDITTDEGNVSFKLMHGKYDCIVMERSQKITTFHITFNESNSSISLDLNAKALLEI
jgi:hypothetical protein